MLLRRISEHVKAQNWIAVAIDFFIVVVGVFIGIQVANWNTAKSDRVEYGRALERLRVETGENFEMLDILDRDFQQSLNTVQQAFAALQSCVESEDNIALINAGLAEIGGTTGFHFRRNALGELLNNSRLLSLQSDEERKRFSDMTFYFDLIDENARFNENHPLEGRFQNNPIIGVGGLEEESFSYYGVDFSQAARQIFLDATVEEACRNDELIKSFYTWELWQDNVPILSRQLRKELNETTALLEARK